MTLQLSPSENHRLLMSHITPALSYGSGDREMWRTELRAKVIELINPLQTDSRAPLDVQILDELSDNLGTIQKIAFLSEPGAHVIGYFCIPHDIRPPYPAVICLQGHSTGMHVSIGRAMDDERELIAADGGRDYALEAMRRGFAALCIEQRSLGYRLEHQQERISKCSRCNDAQMHAFLMGRTLVGERVFDVDRGLDYLSSRGDIDMSRVGALGNSGGGVTTIFGAAILDRLQFAVPSCSLSMLARGLMSTYHCPCSYVPRLALWADLGDVLALFAPKPLVVVAGEHDDLFPIDSAREAYSIVERAYRDVGAGDQCALVVGEGGHQFYADAAWEQLSAILKTQRPTS